MYSYLSTIGAAEEKDQNIYMWNLKAGDYVLDVIFG